MGRMGTRYDALINNALAQKPIQEESSPGGWFLAPKQGLDPRLFDGDRLRPEIRQELLGMLYGFWQGRYAAAESWSTAWIAGSQATRQWRDEGDLDVLIGINTQAFLQHNPAFRGFPEKIVAEHLNTELREQLWEDDWYDAFEVTFYVNPKTGDDIRNISPYAAYNLSTDAWDVEPPDLPDDWSEEQVPPHWRQAVQEEITRAREIISRYGSALGQVRSATPTSPQWVTASHGLYLATEQARELYEIIHGQRKRAFQGEAGVAGAGFFDYHNYRWQAHKSAGTAKALASIRDVGQAADAQTLDERYGAADFSNQPTPGNLPSHYR